MEDRDTSKTSLQRNQITNAVRKKLLRSDCDCHRICTTEKMLVEIFICSKFSYKNFIFCRILYCAWEVKLKIYSGKLRPKFVHIAHFYKIYIHTNTHIRLYLNSFATEVFVLDFNLRERFFFNWIGRVSNS
jgi:hypothetical protein